MNNDERRKRHAFQPLDVIQNPDSMLRMRTVEAVTGMSEWTIRRLVRQGTFPLPVRQGRAVLWHCAAIMAWNKARLDAQE